MGRSNLLFRKNSWTIFYLPGVLFLLLLFALCELNSFSNQKASSTQFLPPTPILTYSCDPCLTRSYLSLAFKSSTRIEFNALTSRCSVLAMIANEHAPSRVPVPHTLLPKNPKIRRTKLSRSRIAYYCKFL